jgi:protein TonB
MKKWIRYGLGMPLASMVTLGLTFSMAQMIATEFKAQDKLEKLDFTINPEERDETIEIKVTELEELVVIEVPPAPPKLNTGTHEAVVEPNPPSPSGPPPVDWTKIVIAGPIMVPIDTNPQPIVRSVPSMPSRANKSGHCNVRFNVSAEGTPYDIETTYCTQSIFERATLRSVSKWKYRPRIQDGRAVAMTGVTNRVVYRLTDEKGNIIPE